MANKEKILLLAMISMILPGALPDAFAEGGNEAGKKAAKRVPAPKSTTARKNLLDRKLNSNTKNKNAQ